jgi:hypothetical protein
MGELTPLVHLLGVNVPSDWVGTVGEKHPGGVLEVSTHPSSPTVPTQSEGKFILMTIDISLVHFFYNRTNFAVILCYGAVVSHL